MWKLQKKANINIANNINIYKCKSKLGPDERGLLLEGISSPTLFLLFSN